MQGPRSAEPPTVHPAAATSTKEQSVSRKANREAASRYRQRKRDREHAVENAVAQVFHENALLREANMQLRKLLPPPAMLLDDDVLLQIRVQLQQRDQMAACAVRGAGGGPQMGAGYSSGEGFLLPPLPPPQQMMNVPAGNPAFFRTPANVGAANTYAAAGGGMCCCGNKHAALRDCKIHTGSLLGED